MKYFICLLLAMSLSACKSFYPISKTINSQSELLAIGTVNSKLLSKEFKTATNVVLKNKVRIGVSMKQFKKHAFKSYQKKLTIIGKSTTLNYIDSLSIKPKYHEFELQDRVAYLKELYNTYNSEVQNYLKQSENLKIITKVSCVLNDSKISLIENADDFYLSTNRQKKTLLSCYKEGREIGVLDINSGFVLNFETSHFCWKKQKSDKITIVDILKKGENCASGTYTNANEIKPKRYDFTKF